MRMPGKIPFLIIMLYLLGNPSPATARHAADHPGQVSISQSHHQPVNRFSSLDDAISYYRRLTEDAPWPALRGDFLLREGDQHPQVAALRQRLWLLGDLDEPVAEGTLFDPALTSAVMRFQYRHGLKRDGIVGSETREVLNVTPRMRWFQLLVNRQRAADDQPLPDGDAIEINIPDYRLFYHRDKQLLISMKVIVGRKKRPTPVMQSAVSAIEFNPDWNVPKRIAFEDMLPVLQQGREGLAALGVKLVEGWPEEGVIPKEISAEQLDMGRFYQGNLASQQRFWQPPGRANPLGQLKFVFANRFSIYMHDTPNTALFQSTRRAFSSGCIRLEKPRELAELLFNAQSTDVSNLIDEHLLSGQAQTVGLSHKVSLFTRYRTAWLEGSDGLLHFRHDIYGRDRNELSFSAVTSPAPELP